MQHTIILHLKTRLHVAQVGVEPARGCRGMAPSPPPCSRCIRICIPIYIYIYIILHVLCTHLIYIYIYMYMYPNLLDYSMLYYIMFHQESIDLLRAPAEGVPKQSHDRGSSNMI